MTKYNWNYWSSYSKGGLKKSAKSQYYSIIQSDYEDYYHEHYDDQYYVISKKRSSSSFTEMFTTTSKTTNTTTTEVSSSSSSGTNKNNVGKKLEWMLVIFVCDDYGEETMKRYNVPLRYISSSPVFKALVRSCGHKFGPINTSMGWVVLPCSIRFFESVYNLAMCQAKEEEEEKAKARCRRNKY